MRTIILMTASLAFCGCAPRTDRDGWERGEYVVYRKHYRHEECGGNLVFNGRTDAAPLSANSRFYEHVCDTCSQTNRMLDQQWPKHKREWRPACAAPLSRWF